MAQLVRQRKAAEDQAEADVAQDKAHYADLVKERASVEKRIAARIAKAAAERKRAAERAAAERKAGAARRSSHATSKHTHRSSGSATLALDTASRSLWLLGSPLHSACDSIRYCTTGSCTMAPTLAPHAVRRTGLPTAVVSQSATTTRVMATPDDRHGYAGPVVTTGYNMPSHYIVHVGQRVREGQIIGYVGTTGFSTGCHLHLMVWIGGRLRNPMTWF